MNIRYNTYPYVDYVFLYIAYVWVLSNNIIIKKSCYIYINIIWKKVRKYTNIISIYIYIYIYIYNMYTFLYINIISYTIIIVYNYYRNVIITRPYPIAPTVCRWSPTHRAPVRVLQGPEVSPRYHANTGTPRRHVAFTRYLLPLPSIHHRSCRVPKILAHLFNIRFISLLYI